MTLLLYFSFLYSTILLCLIMGMLKTGNAGILPANKRYIKSKEINKKNYISVIIACKNEENNINRLINSLKNQTYHKDFFEVIFADDDSKDSTAQRLKQEIEGIKNYHYLLVEQSAFPEMKGKKRAISYATQKKKQITLFPNDSDNSILVFTDADCSPEIDWLSDINQAFVNGCDFYTGYSPIISKRNSFINDLKNLERASIFAVSASSFGLGLPLTCTARNIAYRATLWEKTQGFKGIENILSGDDDLMLHKLRHHIQPPTQSLRSGGGRVGNNYHFSFNPNAFVPTHEEKKLSDQLNQETRRTSKFKYYPFYVQLLILSITIFYLLLVYSMVMAIVTMSISIDLILSIVLKIALEFTLLSIFLIKVKHYSFMKGFLLAELLYIPYFILFGIKGTLGKYKWKN